MMSLFYGLVVLLSMVFNLPQHRRQFIYSSGGRFIIFSDYGGDLKNCSGLEIALRHVGLQRIEPKDYLNISRVLLPDLGAFVITLITIIVCVKTLPTENSSPERNENDAEQSSSFESRLTAVTQLVATLWMTTILAICGIVYPCIISFFYLISFLTITLYWALYRTLGRKFFAFRLFLQLYAAIHLLLIYCYQMPAFQLALPPSSLTARLLGFTELISRNCDKPWMIIINQHAQWTMFVNPIAVFVFYITIATMNRLSFTFKKTTLFGKKRSSKRRNENDERRALIEDDTVRLTYNSMDEVNESANATLQTERDDGEEVQINLVEEPSANEQSNLSTQTTIKSRSAFTDVMQAMYKYWLRHSHFSALIIMLAWSITYHSWLSFLMLLAACIIWMTPQKSKLLLTLSPVIVFYGICLVLLQYIYGLQLSNEELPVNTTNGYPLSELGLVKYGEKSCFVLTVKLLFTLGFFFTMRQWSYERKMKNDAEALANLSLRLVENGARKYFNR
ncbi:DgyrCDS133 [Dimorphilus gyrociliatus]|uniref:DgyrCDS133 n=1 Tax=Dimorphilus gyrociliatus TaxID=2664684 RepID=A0A7I8V5E3_9ANNE|nr:DgyrCDS133 [Dimorphilus gyrociliatus]